jgi:hypothetical protein
VQVLAERVSAQNTTLVLSPEDDHREYLDELELELEQVHTVSLTIPISYRSGI